MTWETSGGDRVRCNRLRHKLAMNTNRLPSRGRTRQGTGQKKRVEFILLKGEIYSEKLEVSKTELAGEVPQKWGNKLAMSERMTQGR